MSLRNVVRARFSFVLFGGKGGVGKTSCAAASALHLAQRGRRTLLFSTDPAHSLSNSWAQAFTGTVRAVRGVPNLQALEINAEAVMAAWKREYGEELVELFTTSTILDAEDAGSLLALPVPGMDELMGLKAMMDLMDAREHEVYVVDTAPTGHTLRLLAMPEVIDRWIKAAARMRWKYRYMVTRFSGKAFEDRVDRFLLDLKRAVRRVNDVLRDAARTEFVVVTIPETMAVLQTQELVAALRAHRIPSRNAVVNRFVPPCNCAFCTRRRKGQARALSELRSTLPQHEITVIEEQPEEVRGRERIAALAAALFRERGPSV
jgi:arsenite-transporting ATPase